MKRSPIDPRYKESVSSSGIFVENLSARYIGQDQQALTNVSLRIRPSSVTLLCGPNGSGKTTLLRILRGLHNLFRIEVSGSVEIDNVDVLGVPPEDLGEVVGIVFQRPSSQLVNVRVNEEVTMGPLLHGWDWARVSGQVQRVLAELGLHGLEHRYSHELSTGEQSKTVLACVSVSQPSVFLLDEPSVFLDRPSRMRLMHNLRRLADCGATVVLTTHRLEDELRYADYVVLFCRGEVMLAGAPENVVFTPLMSKIVPPRAFLKISEMLWENRRTQRKLFDPLDLPTPPSESEESASETRDTKDTILRCTGVTLTYSGGTVALEDVNLEFHESEIACILGANGSGKTSLGKLMVGAMKPSRGAVELCNRNIMKFGRQHLLRTVGYSPTDPTDILFKRVSEELADTFKKAGIDPSHERVNRVLSDFGLLEKGTRFTETLSLGEQKRLALAIAIALRPRLLVLDEPSIGLDSGAAQSFAALLLELREHAAIVIVTHDVNTFLPIADRIHVLDHGRVAASMIARAKEPPEPRVDLSMIEADLWGWWRHFPTARTWDQLGEKILASKEIQSRDLN